MLTGTHSPQHSINNNNMTVMLDNCMLLFVHDRVIEVLRGLFAKRSTYKVAPSHPLIPLRRYCCGLVVVWCRHDDRKDSKDS